MWWMLLAIIGCYAFAALMVRMAARFWPGWRSGMHVVLFAGNQEDRVEWYLRRLRWWSLRTGRDVCVTLVDCESTDDTAMIAERFGRRAGAVTVVRSDEIAEIGDGISGDPRALKEHWLRRQSAMPAVAFYGAGCRDGDGRGRGFVGFGGFGELGGGQGQTLLINLSDPADVAMLP